MYVKHCKLTKNKQLELMKYFAAGSTARTAADLAGIQTYLPTNIIMLTAPKNFWNQAKRHMRKFNGIPKQHFNLFLKECEWRFNMGSPKQLLDDLKTILKNTN